MAPANGSQPQEASQDGPRAEIIGAFDSHSFRDEEFEKPTNEYVLNVAFFSFLGFTLLQTGFALIAKSQAMLADSEAMFVDALTYLFNLLAERLKHRPYSESERQIPLEIRRHNRKLIRLYLELIPPFLSVSTLIAVTVITLRDSMRTLLGDHSVSKQPDLNIMLIFSGANLLLDVVNVVCFAKADQAIGLMHTQSGDQVDHHHYHSDRRPTEHTQLISTKQTSQDYKDSEMDVSEEESQEEGINLNMCSAWTHVCADTLRSVAVLIAAGIAYVWDELTADVADSVAAIIVSFIIIFSLMPLIQGLYFTAYEIWIITRRGAPPRRLSIVV